MQKQKRENIRRAVFLIYLMLTIRLIIFKYPFADLKEIMDTWQSGVIPVSYTHLTLPTN